MCEIRLTGVIYKFQEVYLRLIALLVEKKHLIKFELGVGRGVGIG